MYNVREITDNLYWVGANDHRTHLFENIHPIPYGVSYNSYVLLDKETVLFDTCLLYTSLGSAALISSMLMVYGCTSQ